MIIAQCIISVLTHLVAVICAFGAGAVSGYQVREDEANEVDIEDDGFYGKLVRLASIVVEVVLQQ